MDDQDFLDQAAMAALPTVLAHDYSDQHDDVAIRCYRVAGALLDVKKQITVAELTELIPATAALGSPNFTLRVIGTGFTPSSLIYWNGSAETTIFVSDMELTTEVNMETAEVALAIPVVVVNTIGKQSNMLLFTLTEAARKRA